MKCDDCKLGNYWCICTQLDEFLEDNRELFEGLAEQEEQDKGAKRCLGCFKFRCTCGSGHGDRLNQL